MSHRRERLRAARLYLVCDAPRPGFLEAALRGGVDIVQLRMKEAEEPAILSAAREVAAACREHGALFILNDRPDLALRAEADGVHVGQDDASAVQARSLLGPARIVGLSTHTPAQIDAAAEAPVDYIGVGPVHATPTKPGRPAVGLQLVRTAADRSRRPFFAIGGIDRHTIGAVRAAGAQRVAVVRALTEADDPEATARDLRCALTTIEAQRGAA